MGGCLSRPKMQKTRWWTRRRPARPLIPKLPTPHRNIQQMQLDCCLWDRDFDDLFKEMHRLDLWDQLYFTGQWQQMKVAMQLSAIRKGDKEQIKRWTRIVKEGEVRARRREVIHQHMIKNAEATIKRASARRDAVWNWEVYRDKVKAREDEKFRRKREAEERKARKRREARKKKNEKTRAKRACQLAKRNLQLNVG
jgi:hypothetical protein